MKLKFWFHSLFCGITFRVGKYTLGMFGSNKREYERGGSTDFTFDNGTTRWELYLYNYGGKPCLDTNSMPSWYH
jgi:hypothetical protein